MAIMEVVVEGEEIHPSELNGANWAQIRRRQRAFNDAKTTLQNPPQLNKQHAQQPRKSRPARRSPPMTQLPDADIKVVLRPRGGLNLRLVAQASLADAIFQAANVPQNATDQIRVHQISNYLLISTPSEERAQKYANIQSLTLKNKLYEIATHVSAPGNTVMGVIFNIPEEDTPEEITRSILEYNPALQILEAKRLGNSNNAQILFHGTKVPFWIRYRAATYRCKPFRRKTEACIACWQPGHRQDVCPNLTHATRCSKCGSADPAEGHQCVPKCVVCDGQHITGSTDCPKRFQPRRKQQTYAQVVADGKDTPDAQDTQTGPALHERRSRSRTPAGRRNSSKYQTRHQSRRSWSKSQTRHQSRSPSANGQKIPQAERGRSTSTKTTASEAIQDKQAGGDKSVSFAGSSSRCSSTPQNPPTIPPDLAKELANIRAEIGLLRQENQALRQENRKLRSQIENLQHDESVSAPPAPKKRATDETVATAENVEAAQPGDQERRFAILEGNASWSRKHITELHNEVKEIKKNYYELHTNMGTLQATIESLRGELHSCMQGVLNTVSNPAALVPQINTQYGQQFE